MQARTFLVGLAGVLALGATPALAGATWSNPISVTKYSDGGGLALGALGDVRASAGTSYIGCDVQAAPSPYVYCSAYDSSRYAYLSCTSSEAAFANLAMNLSPSSALAFNADANGNCTWMRVSTWSAITPIVP
jgi:hypothetical protein